MKNLTRILGTGFLLFSVHAQSGPTKVSIAFEDADSFPFQMKNKTGLDFMLLEKVDAALADVEFEFLPGVPWKRCLSLIENDADTVTAGNAAQGCFSGSYKDERAKIGVYPGCHLVDDSKAVDGEHCNKGAGIDKTQMLHLSSYTLYSLNTALKVEKDFSVVGLNKDTDAIAAPLGYSIGDDLTKAGWKRVDTGSPKTTQNFAKLMSKKVAAVAALTQDGDYFLAEDAKQKKEYVTIKPVGTLIEKPYYLLLSRHFVNKNKAVAEVIWKKIAEVRESEGFKKESQEWIDKMTKGQ